MFGTPDDGVAALFGFDLTAMLSDAARACVLGRVLSQDMGILIPAGNLSCVANGVDAPIAAASYGFSLAGGTPNPFASTTSIRFSLAARTAVRVDVYDVLGRRVRTLANERLDPGTHVRDWDGREDSGARATNGVYFVRMAAGTFEATQKLVMLK